MTLLHPSDLENTTLMMVAFLHSEKGSQAMRDALGREVVYLPHLKCFLVSKGHEYTQVQEDEYHKSLTGEQEA